ncbi:MAG: methionine--tRNA ligase [Candidatus Aminicenantes bacterium]|nr:methionine--tRNA ligase [Candidatus Aminicenantes bacterium]
MDKKITGTEAKGKFFLTTPIYYVNDIPHLGHAYTTIMADVIKRYKTMRGYEVFFLTGTDEHGQKIEKNAQKKGITPKELADSVVVRFKELWKRLNIDYDKFIRTTDDFHIEGVKKIFRKVQNNGDIYPGDYKGHYCVSCESFVSDTAEDTPSENKICPDCERETEKVVEKCYFFKLSAYQDKLLKFYDENPDFIQPKSRMNEVRSFVTMGLRDLSITRSTVSWGIPVPEDEEQTIYVWFDALTNYITGINYLEENEKFRNMWPADLHVMAKDILKFHAVYWPAFLMSAELPLPKKELIHGWWLKDEKKMSKSIGNVLDPNVLFDHFNSDAIRYFLMREAPIGADGNFSHQGFINRINTDLSNDWGNLISRTGGMIGKYLKNKFSGNAIIGPREKEIEDSYVEMEKVVIGFFDDYKFNRGIEKIFEYIGILNKYIVEKQPWALASDESKKKELEGVLLTLVRAILSINSILYPVTPETSENVAEILNYKTIGFGWKDTGNNFTIKETGPLFPRVDLKDFLKSEEVEVKKETPGIEKQEKEEMEEGLINFDDFKKVEMVVALVNSAEKIENADKLLKLEVDTGSDTRTLVAGIALHYSPSDLIGKKIIIVKNLKPVKLRGVLSQGMILAASDKDGRPYIPEIPNETPVGAILK